MEIVNKIRPAITLAVVFLFVVGLAYPIAVAVLANVLFPFQANGEQIVINGTVMGSHLIAQNFSQVVFFHPWNGSASGVDPTITLAYAYSQVQNVSAATGLPQPVLEGIVNSSAQYTMFFFGPRYVNVVDLNLYLMQRYPTVYSKYSAMR